MKKLLLLITGIFLVGCSGKDPVITEVRWHLNVVDERNKNIQYESLSLFVDASDEDGEDDLDFLYLINDDEQLYWEIGSDRWQQQYQEDRPWVGSNFIYLHDKGPFPRSEYRVMLKDRSGAYTEESIHITLNKIDTDTISWPELIINEGNITWQAAEKYEDAVIWAYSGNGDLLFETTMKRGTTPIEKVITMDMTPIDYIYTYVRDPDLNCGIYSGPWYLK